MDANGGMIACTEVDARVYSQEFLNHLSSPENPQVSHLLLLFIRVCSCSFAVKTPLTGDPLQDVTSCENIFVSRSADYGAV